VADSAEEEASLDLMVLSLANYINISANVWLCVCNVDVSWLNAYTDKQVFGVKVTTENIHFVLDGGRETSL